MAIVGVEDGAVQTVIDNPGKLGAVAVSPDGRHVAMITAADPNDPQSGRLAFAPIEGGAWRDLMPDLEGHVSSMAWRDAETISFIADLGEETLFGEISLEGGEPAERLLSGTEVGGVRVPVMGGLDLARHSRLAAFVDALRGYDDLGVCVPVIVE